MTENGREAMKVLITGSSQGIGKELARAFAAAGHEVTVHASTSMEKAEAVRAEIGAAHSVTAELSDTDQVKALYEKTGDVDCLILNASVQYKETWDAITEESMEKQWAVNVKSSLLLMQLYIPAMQKKGFGRVITVGSVNQNRVHPQLSLYSATKCAVMRLVQNIAREVAPYGVTVNNVSPGAIATPRNEDIYSEEAKRRVVEAQIPMGRFGLPSDCVGAVLLLCGEKGGYITGTDIIIDGGMLLQ